MNKDLTRHGPSRFKLDKKENRVLTDTGPQGKDPRHDDGIRHSRDHLQLAHNAGWSRLVPMTWIETALRPAA
jgi:hypothetical protein